MLVRRETSLWQSRDRSKSKLRPVYEANEPHVNFHRLACHDDQEQKATQNSAEQTSRLRSNALGLALLDKGETKDLIVMTILILDKRKISGRRGGRNVGETKLGNARFRSRN